MNTVYIGIGSNLGDSYGNCVEAINKINKIPGCTVSGISGFYITEPVGVTNHEWYVNAVISLITEIPADELLNNLLSIEKEMGRDRGGRHWAPREIDLDILLYGEEILNQDNLTVPHPLMHCRRFVMAPIAELAPDLVHPVMGKSMKEILLKIPDDEQTVSIIGEK